MSTQQEEALLHAAAFRARGYLLRLHGQLRELPHEIGPPLECSLEALDDALQTIEAHLLDLRRACPACTRTKSAVNC